MTALEDLVECIIQSHDYDAYSHVFLYVRKEAEYIKENMGDVDELWNRVHMCIPKLLSRMHSDLDNQKLQQRCKKVLSALNDVLDDVNERNYYVIGEVLSFVQERPEDPSAARFGFCLIKNEFMDYYDEFSSIVIDIMICHESDPVVQEYAMSCLKEYFGLFPEQGRESRATRIFLQAMRTHPDNSHVQVATCDVLYFSDEAIITEEWPPVTILQAMTNHPQCANVQAATFLVLKRMFDFDEDGKVRTVLTGQDYVQPILRAMENHEDNASVQNSALWALQEMTTESSTFTHIIQGRGVELTLRAMRNQYDRALDAAVIILERLFGSSVDSRRTAIASDAIPLLLDVLRMNNSTLSKNVCTAP
jgi:hypothetical protein